MRDVLLIAAVLAGLADVLWVNARHVRLQNRCDRLELELWADLHGTRGRPITLAREPQLALPATTGPTTSDLWAWLAATDDHPATVTGRPLPHHGFDTVTPQPRLRLVEQMAAA